ELPVRSGAPTGDGALLEEHAGVAAPGDELLDGARHVDGEGLLGVAGGGPVAELTAGLVAPAFDHAIRLEDAGVPLPRGGDLGALEPGDVGRHAAVVRGALAELAVIVVPPGLDGAVAEADEEVIFADPERGHPDQTGDGHRGVGVVGLAGAQRTGGVGPP